MSTANPSRAPDSAPVPESLAGLRSRIDTAVRDAADRAATAAGGRILTAAGVRREVGVTWTYYQDGHLGGMAEVSTSRADLESLCAAVAKLTGGEVTRDDGPPAVVEVCGWVPAALGTPVSDRLLVTVHGLLGDHAEQRM